VPIAHSHGAYEETICRNRLSESASTASSPSRSKDAPSKSAPATRSASLDVLAHEKPVEHDSVIVSTTYPKDSRGEIVYEEQDEAQKGVPIQLQLFLIWATRPTCHNW
jgi:hypothetical protein